MIAADQQKTFVIFIYGDIQWSFPRFIVFSPGVGLDLPTNQELNIDEGSNVNVTGVYIYQVDCSVVGPNNNGENLLVLLVTREICWACSGAQGC